MMTEKICLECHKPIRGRADKRFCDDGCRNAYNNKLNSDSNNLVRQINGYLRKNRRVLQDMLGAEKMKKTSRSKMQQEGFRFDYHTHTLMTGKGHAYFFCYEYGYLALDNNMILIVKKKEN